MVRVWVIGRISSFFIHMCNIGTNIGRISTFYWYW